jgi:hypothetical protein
LRDRAIAVEIDRLAAEKMRARRFARAAARALWVDQNGGDLATIKFAEMAYSTMTGALAAGRVDAARWANDKRNQARSGEILAKYTSMDPATISTMTRVHFGEQLLPALVQPQIDVAAKYVPFATFPAMEIIDARAR